MKKATLYLVKKARQNRRNQNLRARSTFIHRSSYGLAALAAIFMVLVWIYLGWQYTLLTQNLPSIDEIPKQLNAQSAVFNRPTRLVDRTGTELLLEVTSPSAQRKYMRLTGVGGKVSKDYINALVSIIEPGYWRSPGYRIDDLRPDAHPTIAQRLVFEMLLQTEPADTRRAIREKLLAAQLIARYGRDQVLEWFVNSQDHGHLAYGVEAAAQTYFGKSSESLSLPEAAMLAGTAAAPALNPWDSVPGSRVLQIETLKTMLTYKHITPEIYQAAIQVNVPITPRKPALDLIMDAYARQSLQQAYQLIGRSRVERGGLVIQTNQDAQLQSDLNCAVKAQLAAIEGNTESNAQAARQCPAARLLPLLPPTDAVPAGSMQASVTVVDPSNGEVLALTGELSSVDESQFTNTHQGGTISLPFLYLTAFTQGFAPASLVWDVPSASETSSEPSRKVYYGPVSARSALVNDLIGPVDQLVEQIGGKNINRLANSFGLTIENEQKLMDQRITILDAARAYSILAAEGQRNGYPMDGTELPSLSFLNQIFDETGRRIYALDEVDSIPVVSSQLTYLVTNSLSEQSVRINDNSFDNISKMSSDAAIKTGITQDGSDVWAAGYSTSRTVVVWMGKTAEIDFAGSIDPRWPAGIWRAAMLTSMTNLPATTFEQPAGVSQITVCEPSGLLPNGQCPKTVDEIFVNGSEPVTTDNLYKILDINAETGRLATVFTPPNLVVSQIFMDVPIEHLEWAKNNQIPIPPTNFDAIRTKDPDPAVHFSSPDMFAYVHGKVDIIGTASSQDFLVYRLQIGEGLNPPNWQQVGMDGAYPVIENLLGSWDTSSLNGLYIIRLQVIDQNNLVRTDLLQVTVDNNPPTVEVSYPLNGTVIQRSETPELMIRAQVNDLVGISKVVISMDGQPIKELLEPPFATNWKVTPGSHIISVTSWDLAGNAGISPEIKIDVR